MRGRLRIGTVRLQHFMSYRAPTVIPIGEVGPGLVLVQGQNLLSTSADSNGAGKTALVQAIAWGLFGETLDGQRHDAVANRHTAETCRVEITGESDGVPFTIERCRRPGRIRVTRGADTWHGEDAARAIETIIGFGIQTFRAGAVFAQAAFHRFITADHAEKVRIFDEINAVDFRAAEQAAGAALRALAQETEQVMARLETCRVRLADAEAHRARLEALRASFAEQRARRCEQLRAERAACAAQRARYAECVALRDRLRAERAAHAAGAQQAAALDADRAQLLIQCGVAQGTLNRITAEQTALRARHAELAKAGVCPTCSQPYARLPERVTDLLREQTTQRRDAEQTLARLRAALRERETARAALGYDAAAHQACESALARVEGELALLDPRELDRRDQFLAAELAAAEREAWSGEADLARLATEIAAHRAERDRLTARRATLRMRERGVTYWREAFGTRGIRLQRIEELGPFLTSRVRHHLRLLAGADATAAVEIGTHRGRETVLVGSAWAYGAGQYVQASAGQRRRIDLALFAAMQDAAELRTARGFPFRVYDEPSDTLDAKGKETVAEWIRAQADERLVLVITHSPEFAAMLGQPKEVWTVVLDRDGSRLERDRCR